VTVVITLTLTHCAPMMTAISSTASTGSRDASVTIPKPSRVLPARNYGARQYLVGVGGKGGIARRGGISTPCCYQQKKQHMRMFLFHQLTATLTKCLRATLIIFWIHVCI
jgi:hypothetical protein